MRPSVKICGLTNYEDAACALGLGADLIGFIFAPSIRQIPPCEAAVIVSRLKSAGLLGQAKTVAVFVNESPERMAAILRETGIDLAQIHGDESPQDCAAFDFPWYRALRISANRAGDAVTAAAQGRDAGIRRYTCSRLLFDAAVPGMYGGSGTTMDKERARAAIASARKAGKEVFVAGGIRPENVAKIVRDLGPDGIDVGSGVEERPGKKSEEKLAALFRELDAPRGMEREDVSDV